MAKRKNNLSGLLSQLGSPKIDGQSLSKLLAPTSLVSASQGGSERTTKPPAAGDTKTSGLSAKVVPAGINFGSPSSNKTSTSSSGSDWTNLLTKTASGGVASAFGGGLSSIAGLGGLISGIASLFGGGSKSAPPPLVEFQLPSSQTQTVYLSSNGGSTYEGSVTQQSGASKTGGAVYTAGSPQAASTGGSTQAFQYQSTQIAQAVKNALLNSSSLNDVIAEI